MEQRKKIEKILSAIKIDVKDLDKFESDVDGILGMFNELKEINVENIDANLEKKKIRITDLREDQPKDWDFRKEMRGKYFKVPNVSKK
jgi:aspartyl/glutamyl-tRNA(Asn/Gln) amidotransferase C subunit